MCPSRKCPSQTFKINHYVKLHNSFLPFNFTMFIQQRSSRQCGISFLGNSRKSCRSEALYVNRNYKIDQK